ncbi:toxin-antitoxin system YwqK family antitoxin [Flavobacterium sp.]|uniref:toxin-antitoxin system YwqK family antitoxin n=1 Tax=Flavobacterium sp. TaxID=239 RepID=UPI00374D8196
MKKYILLTVILFSGVVFAQGIEPKYEIEGNLVKATYFHDNGQVKQVGFYKDGKVEGKWISYNEAGNKLSLGEYTNGEKTGKWFFWDKNSLNEVDYSDSRVAEVKKWSTETVVQRN